MFEILVPLVHDPNDWQPLEAVHLRGRLYRIIGSAADPQETRFIPGDVVECESETAENGKRVLRARRLAPAARFY